MMNSVNFNDLKCNVSSICNSCVKRKSECDNIQFQARPDLTLSTGDIIFKCSGFEPNLIR